MLIEILFFRDGYLTGIGWRQKTGQASQKSFTMVWEWKFWEDCTGHSSPKHLLLSSWVFQSLLVFAVIKPDTCLRRFPAWKNVIFQWNRLLFWKNALTLAQKKWTTKEKDSIVWEKIDPQLHFANWTQATNTPIMPPLQFAVTRTDGTPYLGLYNRQVTAQVLHEGQSTRTYPERKLIIPDDNIIRLEVMPLPGDEEIRIRVRKNYLCFPCRFGEKTES